MNVQRPSVPQTNQFTLDQVRDLTEGGVAVSDGMGNLGILKKPTDRLPTEWQNFKGQLPDFRPMSKAAVVGALWRAAGISEARNTDDAAKDLGERLKEILTAPTGTAAGAARLYLSYRRQAQVDSKAAGPVPKGDVKSTVSGLGNVARGAAGTGATQVRGEPAPAKTETKAASGGAASDKTDAGSPRTAGGAKSRADLKAFISGQGFATGYEKQHIREAVAWAAQAAQGDPALNAKYLSGTLTRRELEDLAEIGMKEVRASVRPTANDDD
ncbi:MAG: hypothetical protein V4609_08530 [Pseudomonadota bacterium]